MSRDPQAGRSPSVDRAASIIAVYSERILIGAVTALFIARPLTAGGDPGRLSLTSGAGALVLNLLSFLLLFAWGIRRIWVRGPFMGGSAATVIIGLATVAGLVLTSTAMPDRYQRPGWFIAWDWVSIAVLCFVAWQLASSPAKVRALTAVLIATAACLSVQALYQYGSLEFGWETTEPQKPPPSEMPLVGDDEFGLNLDQGPPPRGHFRATFDQPETLASFLILFLPTAFVWGISGWRRGGSERLAIGVPLVIAAAAAIAVSFMFDRSGYCSMQDLLIFIGQAPYWGGGPGNLSRITDIGFAHPGNYWLGLATTAGLPALAALLLTLFVALWLNYRRARSVTKSDAEERKRTPWEFYIGGVAGLLLGMMLAMGDIPAESPASEILRLGVVGGCRTLVWLLAFSLLETANVTDRARILATITGVTLVAALGCFCDALSSPALMQPFWLALTLAAAGSRTRNWSPTSLPYAIAGISLAIFLLAANLLHVTWPGCATASSVRSARQASREYPHLHWKIVGQRGQNAVIATKDAAAYLNTEILLPLHEAVKTDPHNSALLLELARWERNHWLYLINLDEKPAAREEALEMLKLAEQASLIDPHSLGPQFSGFESVRLFTSRYQKASDDQLNELDKYIKLIAKRQPDREVELRYRVALLLLTVSNQESLQKCSIQLLRLDTEPGAPHGHLSKEQRNRLIVGIKNVVKKPSPELAELLSEVRD